MKRHVEVPCNVACYKRVKGDHATIIDDDNKPTTFVLQLPQSVAEYNRDAAV
jgi:hypothetical protein